MTRPLVLAYHFPQYHRDPRNDAWHGPGWTEWDLLRTNPPRFPGHRPLQPAWGPCDEADPAQAAREIDLAADHGIDGFIFDTYHFADGPFLDRAIDQGFLGAANVGRMRFACMWANHDWRDWHPVKATQNPWADQVLAPGAVDLEGWRQVAARHQAYMRHPQYLRIDGRPWFSLFDLRRFIDGLGGLQAAADALGAWRAEVRRDSGAEPWLVAIANNWKRYGGDQAATTAQALGLDAIMPYNQFDHHGLDRIPGFPVGDWTDADAGNRAAWAPRHGPSGLPYIADVTTGWDTSPRACASDAWIRRSYPWFPVMRHDPERFRRELAALRDHLAAHPDAPQILTLNAWNEWTEGAVLLPTVERGTAMLEQVRAVFGTA
ncbi:MAG: hypothetical protein RLZZ127_1453 [Planctomycetota bacterium]|jgi:hypothetical protein